MSITRGDRLMQVISRWVRLGFAFAKALVWVLGAENTAGVL